MHVFLSALAQGKLNFGEVIQRKFPNFCLFPSWCVMHNRSVEASNHLFLHRFLASKLWYKLCKEANFLWVIPRSCASLLMENFFAFGRGRKAKTLWKCAVAALFWVMWEERNVHIF